MKPKLKLSSDKQRQIIAELDADRKVWCGFQGSRKFRMCETLVRNNPECLRFKYETTRNRISQNYGVMVYLIYKKTRLAK